MKESANAALMKGSAGVQGSRTAALRLARGFLRVVSGFASRVFALAVWILSLAHNLYQMALTTIEIRADTMTREEAALWLLERETVVKWRPAIVDGNVIMKGDTACR